MRRLNFHNHTCVNETCKRSFLRGVTGRLLDVLVDALLFSPFIVAQLSFGLSTLLEVVCLMLHFINDRLWNLTDWKRNVANGKVNDGYSRTIVKGATGKIFEVAFDFYVLSFFVNNELSLGLAVTIEAVCYLVQIFNERLWNLTNWNRHIISSQEQPELHKLEEKGGETFENPLEPKKKS